MQQLLDTPKLDTMEILPALPLHNIPRQRSGTGHIPLFHLGDFEQPVGIITGRAVAEVLFDLFSGFVCPGEDAIVECF